jgi:beta-lactamase class A
MAMSEGRFLARAALLAVLHFSLLCTAVTACTPENPVDEILASPAGQRMAWALEAVRPGAALDPSEVFTPDYFEVIPRSAIEEAVRAMGEDTGGLNLVSAWESGNLQLTAATQAANDSAWWRVQVDVEEDAPFRITRLAYNRAPEFGPPEYRDWTELDQAMAELDGRVSFAAYAWEGNDLNPLLLHNPDLPLAIGSTFKLWVLGALAESITQGEASWSEELAIRNHWKSLPSGRMQDLPENELRTLAEYAEQMISVSDNTATDHLINRIGREEVEDFAERHGSEPGRNRPFLTTYELFKLKINADSALLHAYLSASEAERRALLRGPVARLSLPDPSEEPESPTAIDQIEWFASASQLCRLMADLVELGKRPAHIPVERVLTRNPGFDWDRNLWPFVAYKGGSEAGVLNLTWMMERRDGRRFVMSLGVNDPQSPVDTNPIILAAASAGKLLERER